jgi:hypothetical protein
VSNNNNFSINNVNIKHQESAYNSHRQNLRNDDNKDPEFNLYSNSKIISMKREKNYPYDVVNVTDLLRLAKHEIDKGKGN